MTVPAGSTGPGRGAGQAVPPAPGTGVVWWREPGTAGLMHTHGGVPAPATSADVTAAAAAGAPPWRDPAPGALPAATNLGAAGTGAAGTGTAGTGTTDLVAPDPGGTGPGTPDGARWLIASVAQPGPAQPGPAQPGPAQPAVDQPDAVQADADQPDADQAGAGRPVAAGTRPWPTPLGPRGSRTRTSAVPLQHRTGRPAEPPRYRAPGLAFAVVLSLLAAFFAWVSAEPAWLALGHGSTGTAVITGCTGSGLGQRCHAGFTARTGFTVPYAVLVAAPEPRRVGQAVPARMVSAGSRTAYAGGRTGLVLRSGLGLGLVLLCGLGVGLVTGARRFARRRTRLGAYAAGLAGPVLLAAGILAASW